MNNYIKFSDLIKITTADELNSIDWTAHKYNNGWGPIEDGSATPIHFTHDCEGNFEELRQRLNALEGALIEITFNYSASSHGWFYIRPKTGFTKFQEKLKWPAADLKSIELSPVEEPKVEVLDLDTINTLEDWNAIDWSKFVKADSLTNDYYAHVKTHNVINDTYSNFGKIRNLVRFKGLNVVDSVNSSPGDFGLFITIVNTFKNKYFTKTNLSESTADTLLLTETTDIIVTDDVVETSEVTVAETPVEPAHKYLKDPFIILTRDFDHNGWAMPEFGLPERERSGMYYNHDEYNFFSTYDEACKAAEKVCKEYVSEEEGDEVLTQVGIARLIGVYSVELPKVEPKLISKVDSAYLGIITANDNATAQSLAA